MDLTQFRRLYPKPRLSWSLYQKFMRKDYLAIWGYLTENEYSPGLEAEEGKRIHKKIELQGPQNVRGLEKYIDVSSGYNLETKLVQERENYYIVCQPDLYTKDFVLDWKTGKTNGYELQLQLYMWAIGEQCKDGYIVPIEEVEGEIRVRKGVKQYARSKFASDWEYRFDDMCNDIASWIRSGRLEKYLLGRF